ncbi:MAG: YkgJ family cysteine cluster protein [Alphaproteobacteria bacterium]|uniref:YkgJ family cysteine cluster protein n=1 Tax=Candidatus Nitrobium versatile TaxID=2884831 RepID=A0A953J9X6_9BACT|nr:YkgJ family cysteine cluster protein [Candidatus Nitrobium versatile]
MREEDKPENRVEILTPQGLESSGAPQKMRMKKRSHCVRCGSCCKGGGPVLTKGDLPLFLSGILSHETAYTIREGELVRTEGDEEIFAAPMELIKIREKEGARGCFFHGEEAGCAIYENRPSQCRAYKCWAPEDLLTGLEKERLTRKEIFGSVGILLEIIARHEEKSSYGRLSAAFERLAQGSEDAVEEIMDALQYDTYVRPFLTERFSVPGETLDLILGRPLVETVNAFGFRIEREGDEYILLPIETEEQK